MLKRLLAADLAPLLVVEERSGIAEEERAKFFDRVGVHAGEPGFAPTTEGLTSAAGVPVTGVSRHADEELLPLLEPLDLDLLVLGGTRILRGDVLDLPRDGVVNSHPGLLPECRGSASVAWSLVHDVPIGATTHLCEAGIDTGDVLVRREVAVHAGDTYEDLCFATLVLAGELMVEALLAWREGRWPELRAPQGESPHPTFRNAPPEVVADARRRLADGTYAHLRPAR